MPVHDDGIKQSLAGYSTDSGPNHIYTKNREEFLKQTQQEQQKISTLDYSLGETTQRRCLGLELTQSIDPQ